MARLRDYIGLLMFSILCVSALFVQSHYFTDSSIVPKWLITLFVFGGLVLYYTIAIWYAHSVSINMFRVGIVLVAICFLQAVLGCCNILMCIILLQSIKLLVALIIRLAFLRVYVQGYLLLLFSCRKIIKDICVLWDG